MTLKDYYQKLGEKNPQLKFRDQVIEKCGISYKTFYKWINGETVKINKLAKERIAKLAEIPVEELFPEPEHAKKS